MRGEVMVRIFVLPALLFFSASPALAQEYVVSVAETAPLPTAYEKRNNWRYYGDYRHTTMLADPNNPLACMESPCLDDGEPGDKGPDLTRGGSATAEVPGCSRALTGAQAQPDRESLDLRAGRSRATLEQQSLSGTLDQKNTTAGSDKWLVLGQSETDPLDVQSSVTFVFGSASVTFNGSLSYGGIRLTKIGELSPAVVDAGGTESGAPDASEAEAGAYGAGAGSGAAPEKTPAAEQIEGGCGCVVARRRDAGRFPSLAWLALALAGWTCRRSRSGQPTFSRS
jgi:hypothetical protein